MEGRFGGYQMTLRMNTCVEILHVSVEGDETSRLICIGYQAADISLEKRFREEQALFDTIIEGMSADMQMMCNSAFHRVAIFEANT